jgi:hypothetical protein
MSIVLSILTAIALFCMLDLLLLVLAILILFFYLRHKVNEHHHDWRALSYSAEGTKILR